MEKEVILIGDKFPEMEVTTTQGKLKMPGVFADKWFVLFSYPGDFAPVGATEFVAFQRKYAEFKSHNCELIGLSPDQVLSHLKWMEWIEENLKVEIEFPIIADTGEIANLLGFVHPRKGTNTVRGIIVGDTKGIIRAILYYPQELGRNVEEILRVIKGLQVSDTHNVLIPADWPENELIEDSVFVPPPSDMRTARERLQEYRCLDWWFCHKRIE
ncbi:MAG: peroxiredoxin [Theionarchaea archaeon]|nr:peroxiredoxin [Theionarchaea archaeon]